MEEGHPSRPVPLRALVLSICALGVPVVAQVFFADRLENVDVLLWLLALIPAFLFAYYRGLRGVAGALAVGMAVLAITQAVLIFTNRSPPDGPLMVGIIVVFVGVAVALGWMSELLHRERRKAENLAMIDDLTGLPNRRLARRFLEMEVAAAQRGRRLTLVMFDLDHFKAYNDNHGHLAGDAVIAAMGHALNENTRRMNLPARWGGEEFVAILSDTTREGALHFVERVRTTLSAIPLSGGPITFSAGIAVFEPSLGSADALLEAADRALYRAKLDGRNRSAVAEPAIVAAAAHARGGS